MRFKLWPIQFRKVRVSLATLICASLMIGCVMLRYFNLSTYRIMGYEDKSDKDVKSHLIIPIN